MKIGIIGAGAWGTALAIHAARSAVLKHEVQLWMRNTEQCRLMQTHRENRQYLPGIALPDTLVLNSSPFEQLPRLFANTDLLVLATPTASARSMLTLLRHCPMPLAWLCKGFEKSKQADSPGLLIHEVAAHVAPQLQTGVLSGPSFAQEVAKGQPTALVAASRWPRVSQHLVQAFHDPSLRVYDSRDVVGVEIGGAVKNVLAIATGLCDGLQLGLNARASLITRGLAEMRRLGQALGAQGETFMGLSGLGDLILTATGNLSRNRQVGLLLAQGMDLETAVASLGHVAEGVYSAQTVLQRAQLLGVEVPITECVVGLLEGRLKAPQMVQDLMNRQATSE